MLVHHADAGGDGLLGAAGDLGPAVDGDLALVGLQQPVEDVHQGGLAGAVLPQQAVDLTGDDVQVDVVVGDQRPEALGDAAQPETRRGVGHVAILPHRQVGLRRHDRVTGRTPQRGTDHPIGDVGLRSWAGTSTRS